MEARRKRLTPEEKEARYKARLEQQRVVRAVVKELSGWHVFRTYPSSSSEAVHTVEVNGKQLRCTCRGFKIRKVGSCVHTKWANAELNR